MNEIEIAKLFVTVRAVCPAQKAEDLTPDAWLQILGKYRIEDAADAVEAVGSRQPWISPGEIKQEIKRIRADRSARIVEPPPNVVEGVRGIDELRALREAIADGRIKDQAEARAYTEWGGSLHLATRRPVLDRGPVRRREIAPATPAFPEIGSRP